ncbi:hypothetical protein C5167_050903 [Papaver somniferum]|uniref:AP2/ERF domain-containing protein n=1 Tax=Papaver somniferum TaxID=3469 RepID=A0A4Y7KST2_PAPSO|nr:hypothetical protein C5167_050903 [Papaver somniferum]
METRSSIELEEGWTIVQIGVTKLINIIEGVPESPMDADLFMKLCTTTYNTCTQNPPYDYSMQLRERYKGVFDDYLTSKVLPAIQEKNDDVSVLQEFVKRWANHNVMVSKISSYFNILDRLAKYQQQPNEVFRKQGRGLKRRSTRGEGGPENLKKTSTFDTAIEAAQAYDDASRRMYGGNGFLNFPEVCCRVGEIGVIKRELIECDVGVSFFREVVYEKVKVRVRDAVIALINQERKGNEIDRTLVKDVLEVFVEIGNENLDYYVNDFETAFLIDMVDYYTRKGFSGIMAVDCFQVEKDWVSYYLHFSTEEKLLKQGLDQLLPENAQQDLGKETQYKA